jgi:hypothetical protein
MSPQQIEAHVDAVAATLGLPLDAAHRPGVLRYFALAARMAALLDAQPLGTADEPANVFVPVSPCDGTVRREAPR